MRVEKYLTDCRHDIHDADLLLFRGQGLFSWLIRSAGRGDYTHAARAVWWGRDIFCCEVREFKGGRAVLLDSQVRKHRGRVDVFRPSPNSSEKYNAPGAAEYMRRVTGCSYGWANIALAAMMHLPIVRLFYRPEYQIDPQSFENPPFCSEACAAADRVGGGVDPVPHLADRLTEPNDLARSHFYKYLFTIAG